MPNFKKNRSKFTMKGFSAFNMGTPYKNVSKTKYGEESAAFQQVKKPTGPTTTEVKATYWQDKIGKKFDTGKGDPDEGFSFKGKTPPKPPKKTEIPKDPRLPKGKGGGKGGLKTGDKSPLKSKDETMAQKIARLRREGKNKEADKLKKEMDTFYKTVDYDKD